MKMILLLSAAYSNANTFVDAGNTLEVGTAKHQMTLERAEDMVVAGRAEEVEVPEADDEHDEVNEGDGLDKLKVAELKDLAAEEEIDLGSATTKPAIIAAIRAHRAV